MNIGALVQSAKHMEMSSCFRTEIPGYGYMLHVAIPFVAWNLVILIAGNGKEVFIPENWQTAHPQTPDEVKDYEWMEWGTKLPPIMIDGFPRTIK